MPNVAIQARVSPELKEEAEAILSDIGMTTTEAIRVFLKQVVNSGGLPFQPTARTPSADSPRVYFNTESSGDLATNEAEDGPPRQIALEQQAFVSQHDALLRAYGGQYIAMHQGRVVDHDVDRVALSLRVRKQYGNQPVLITLVRAEILQDIVIRSPRLLPF